MSYLTKEEEARVDKERFVKMGRTANYLFQGAAGPDAYESAFGDFSGEDYHRYVKEKARKDFPLAAIGTMVGIYTVIHFTPLAPVAVVADAVLGVYSFKKWIDLGYDGLIQYNTHGLRRNRFKR